MLKLSRFSSPSYVIGNRYCAFERIKSLGNCYWDGNGCCHVALVGTLNNVCSRCFGMLPLNEFSSRFIHTTFKFQNHFPQCPRNAYKAGRAEWELLRNPQLPILPRPQSDSYSIDILGYSFMLLLDYCFNTLNILVLPGWCFVKQTKPSTDII